MARASAVVLATAALAACGGGGAAIDATAPSQADALTIGANAALLPSDSTDAQAASVAAAQAVVATAQLGQSVDCAGGGTATFTASGVGLGALTNGQFNAGEHVDLTFADCRSAAGAASVTGALALDVISVSGSDYTLGTSTSQLVVALPQRTLTLNGSSTLGHSVTTAGTETTTTDHWTTPSLDVTVQGASSSDFRLTNVDETLTVVRDSGVVVSTQHTGSGTLTATLPGLTFSVTVSTPGGVTASVDGTPLSGGWSIALPSGTLVLSVAQGIFTLALDLGAGGNTVYSNTYPAAQFVSAAG
jgi:hypothetical protein